LIGAKAFGGQKLMDFLALLRGAKGNRPGFKIEDSGVWKKKRLGDQSETQSMLQKKKAQNRDANNPTKTS
jgi:hypothetical protein